MSSYLLDRLMGLTSDNPMIRKAAASYLVDDPVAAQAQIRINPHEQPKITTDEVNRAMAVLGNYGEKTYYAYLANKLASPNEAVFRDVLGYWRADKGLPDGIRQTIEVATNNGTRPIDLAVRDSINQMVGQYLDGKAQRARERQQAGFYSVEVPPNERNYPAPIDEDEVIVVPKAPAQITYPDPYVALLESSKEIVNAPQSASLAQLDERATAIYKSFQNTVGALNVPISRETIYRMFVTFKAVAPNVMNAVNGGDEMKRLIGSTVNFMRVGQIEAAQNNLLDILYRYNVGVNQLLASSKEKEALISQMNEAGKSLEIEKSQLVAQNTAQLNMMQEMTNKGAQLGMELRSCQFELADAKTNSQMLQNQIVEKQAEINRLNGEYETFRANYEGYLLRTKKESEEENKRNREAAVNEINKLVDELETEKTTVQQLELQRQEALRREEDLQGQLTRIKGSLKVIVGVKATVAETVQELISRYNSVTNSLEETENEKSKYYELSVNLKEQLKKKEEVISTQVKVIKEQKQVLISREETIKELRAQVADANGSIETYKGIEISLREQINTKTTKIIEIEATLKSSKSLSEGEIQAKKAEIESLQAEIKINRATMSDYNKQIASLNESVKGMNSKITEYETEVARLNGEEAALKGQIEALSKANASLEECGKGAQAKIAALQDELSQAKKDNSSLALQMASANEVVEQTKIAQAQAENNAKLLEESEKRLKDMEKLKDRAEIEKKELEEAKKSKETALQKEIGRLSRETERLAKELGVSKSNYKELYSQWQKAQEDHDQRMEVEVDDHVNDVIMTGVEAPPLPTEVVNSIMNVARIQDNKAPKVLPEPVVAADDRAGVLPPKVGGSGSSKNRKAVSKRAARIKSTNTTKLLKGASKKAKNSTSKGHTVRASSRRVRNAGAAGGYVVGGRPDPLISPSGRAFWMNVYKNNYHLF